LTLDLCRFENWQSVLNDHKCKTYIPQARIKKALKWTNQPKLAQVDTISAIRFTGGAKKLTTAIVLSTAKKKIQIMQISAD
jgi:hypothetical protein